MKRPQNFRNLVLLAVLSVVALACNNNHNDKTPDVKISYELPGDIKTDATQSELGYYAWQEFFALNWQSSYSKDNLRTLPDKEWDFKSEAQPPLTVWETYIHRTELRPGDSVRTADLSKGLPKYSFTNGAAIDTVTNKITLNNYWNILDEDSEIGSAYLFAHKNKHQVLYAAKTNLEEYNYVKKYFPNDDDLRAAGTLGSTKGLNYLTSLTKEQMCKSDSISSLKDPLICLPCANDEQEGAVEIKLAFRKLDASSGDDPSRYITKEVVVFKPSTLAPYKVEAQTETFGLIGMHIIRKTENFPSFIFASWEQVDQRNSGMQTIGQNDDTVNGVSYMDVDPHRLTPVIERVIPETLQDVNKVVQDKIKAENKESVWQYYQLIGVQGNPIDYADRTSDNNYFMANFVIESDLALTNFHGSFGSPFDTSIQNVVSDGKSFNMGGCQGCHGEAQVGGTDFSFLLDFVGKPVPVPDSYFTCSQACVSACTDSKTGVFDEACNLRCQQSCIKSGIAKTVDPKQSNDVMAYIKTLEKK
jgi:hypothetical protein